MSCNNKNKKEASPAIHFSSDADTEAMLSQNLFMHFWDIVDEQGCSHHEEITSIFSRFFRRLCISKKQSDFREKVALTMFRDAAKAGDVQLAEAVIVCFNLNIDRLNLGTSLLNEACIYGQKELVEFLIRKGATDLTDICGDNAALSALLSGTLENLEFVLSIGFSPVSETGRNALDIATIISYKGAMLPLLKAGAPVGNIGHVYIPDYLPNFKQAGWKQHEENQQFDNPEKVYPLSLLSRNIVRRNLKTNQNMLVTTKQLPLPKALKYFILFGKN
jgi:hypothetical protein